MKPPTTADKAVFYTWFYPVLVRIILYLLHALGRTRLGVIEQAGWPAIAAFEIAWATVVYGFLTWREHGGRAVAALLTAWLVPGAGHLVLGQKGKAAAFFLILGALYGAGLVLCSGHTPDFADQPFYAVGQFGSAATWALGEALSFPKARPVQEWPIAWFEAGLLYLAAAGLLNLLVTLNIPLSMRRKEPAA